MNEQVLEGNMVKEFESSVNNILEFMQKTPSRLEELTKQLSDVNLEISDFNHYLEFATFNASEGYCIARELKDLRVKRRVIKDELEQLKLTYDRFSCMVGGIKKVETLKQGVDKSIKETSNKAYRPRVRVDLFERIKDKVNII